MPSQMQQIHLRLPDELVASVDQVRGSVGRNRFMRAVVKTVGLHYSTLPHFDAEQYVDNAERGVFHWIGQVALEHMYDAVVITDNEWAVEFWNRGAERAFDWPVDEALGRHVRLLLHTDFTRDEELERAQTLRAGHVWQGEGTWYGRDRRPVRAQQVITPLRYPDGELRGVVALFREVALES